MSTLTIELDSQTEQRLKQLQRTQGETISRIASQILADSVALLFLKSPDEMSDEELLAYLEAENGNVTPPTGEKIRPEQTTYIVGTEISPDNIMRLQS